MIDLGLIDYGAGLVARLPNILFGQFYLTNKLTTVGTTTYAAVVRPPLLSGSDYYTEISLIVDPTLHFPYGLTVEPDV